MTTFQSFIVNDNKIAKLPNMGSFTFKFIILLIVYSCASIALRYQASIAHPFVKFKWQNVFNMKFVCNETFFTIKECSEQCYNKEKTKKGCAGFILSSASRGCSVCKPASLSEIASASSTQIKDDQVVYLKKRNKKTDVYFPLEPENITGTTVAGVGISGTLLNKIKTSAEMGKLGQGLHVRNGGQIKLNKTVNKCFSNITTCQDDSLAIMMWIKKSGEGIRDPHLTFSQPEGINLQINEHDKLGMWVRWGSSKLYGLTSSSTIVPGAWIHVAAVYNHNIGGFIYLNGILEAFNSISNSVPHWQPCKTIPVISWWQKWPLSF